MWVHRLFTGDRRQKATLQRVSYIGVRVRTGTHTVPRPTNPQPNTVTCEFTIHIRYPDMWIHTIFTPWGARAYIPRASTQPRQPLNCEFTNQLDNPDMWIHRIFTGAGGGCKFTPCVFTMRHWYLDPCPNKDGCEFKIHIQNPDMWIHTIFTNQIDCNLQ